MNATFEIARRHGAGAVVTNGAERFTVSDYSPATGDVYGHDTSGAYLKLAPDLRLIPARVIETENFAKRISALGFTVFIAKSGDYGFITDDKRERVLSFGWRDYNLSGNYGPPSTESGTGWQMSQTPGDLRTAEDVQRALYATAPDWTRRGDKGWKHYTTVDQHLAHYGKSSGYVEWGAG